MSWCEVESHPVQNSSCRCGRQTYRHQASVQHNATLQQDNARPHVALVVTNFLIQNNVNVLPWPAISPDLSPIEHIWDEMQCRLRGLQNQPLMLPDLSSVLVSIWNGIPQAFFRTLVASMRRHCQACIDSNG